MNTLSGLLLLTLALSAQAAQLYKWTDKDGRVHYSDKPVASAQKVEVKAPGPSQPATAADPKLAEARAKECENKRTQLTEYQKATKVIERDSLGKEKEFSEEERVQLIARVQKQVDELCAAQPQQAAAE